MNCSVCKKPLSDPVSVEAGMGPICRARMVKEAEGESHKMIFLSIPMDDEHGVILQRIDGKVATNVPWLVKEHSPDGFEWGYGGSGPADLALNIVEVVLRQTGYDGPITKIMWNGDQCFSAAYQMHQEFKWEFITSMPEEGGSIPMRDIREWIEQHKPGQADMF